MKRTQFITGIIVAAVGLTAVAVQAKEGGKMRPEHGPRINFEEVDANGDGFLTMEELENQHKARFEKADTNGDGALSAEEMQAAIEARMKERSQKMTERMIERHDANGDGVLTPDEMQPKDGKGERHARMFERVDADSDGKISKEEFDQAREKMRKGPGGKRFGHGEEHHGWGKKPKPEQD